MHQGTSLVVQWLRLRAPSAGGLGSIPGRGTRSHMLQLKILHASTKNGHSQINKIIKKKKKKKMHRESSGKFNFKSPGRLMLAKTTVAVKIPCWWKCGDLGHWKCLSASVPICTSVYHVCGLWPGDPTLRTNTWEIIIQRHVWTSTFLSWCFY